MFHIKINFTKLPFIVLGCLLLITSSIHATEKPDFESGSTNWKQTKITSFFTAASEIPSINTNSSRQKSLPTTTVRKGAKTKRPASLDLPEDLPPKKKAKVTEKSSSPEKSRSKTPQNYETMAHKPTQESSDSKPRDISLKKPPLAESPSQKINRAASEMRVSFLHGTDDHTQAYSNCIAKAESHIIIASWNLNFIPETIFSSLLAAKRRGVNINFVVGSVKRHATQNYFVDKEDDESTFELFETKSHAKFLFVDSKSLILGSYNALGDSFEETEDASFMLEGSVKQLWPFYMSIYETYTSIGEDLRSIFGGIAMISKARNPGERRLLQRSFEDGSQIFLLRTIKEHEDFFRLATPHNGSVTIYSPFSTKDNTLKRLKSLESLLHAGTEVNLKVLERFESGLGKLLSLVPNLKSHARIEVTKSHQKIVIVGNETICAGSLNWLSAAQDAKDLYSNVELSLVLQGPKAEGFIKSYYNH